MKIIVITAMHARHSLNNIFAMAMSRLKRDFGIETMSVITTGDTKNIEICEKYDLRYVTSKNKPVSDKFNVGVGQLKESDWDYLMVLGSDDIPSNRFIELQMEGRGNDFIAISDMWFWGLNPKRAGWDQFYYWRAGSSRLGAGRTLSRRVIEACDYKLWPSGYNAGLDSQSAKRIRSLVPDLKSYSYSMKPLGGFLVDIKYELHISSLSPIMRRCEASSHDIIWEHLPGDECAAILRLREKVAKDNYLWREKKNN